MQELDEPTLRPFTASDGENLAVQDWPLAPGRRRGAVLLVHGLGEHAGRYDALAQRLNAWGFAVRGYDHYGHGDSSGPRGGLTSDLRLLDDLADLLDATRARLRPGEPLVLLGHSMGALVAASLVARHIAQGVRPVDALVLSSPALVPVLNPLQQLLLAMLPRLAPNLSMGNGLNPEHLSHDPAVVAAYRADRRCHDRISARLARFIADAGPATLACAARWTVPTLLLWGEDDRIVNPAGSRAFAAAAPAGVVQAHGFAGLYHEVFNETHAAPVFDALQQWLDQRCPALPTRQARAA